jgi:hypothetical protein
MMGRTNTGVPLKKFKAGIFMARRVGILGAGKLREPADQEVRPTLGSPRSEKRMRRGLREWIDAGRE